MEKYYNDLFKRYLNINWFRPESALCDAIRSKSINKFLKHLKSPSIDISGGDGTVSFIACGGKFNSDFDIYQSVGNLKSVHKDNTDIFDFLHDVLTEKLELEKQAKAKAAEGK